MLRIQVGPRSVSRQWQQPLEAASSSQTDCASQWTIGIGPTSRNGLKYRHTGENTYILWVRVDPAESHQLLLNLALVNFDLILHSALVLLASLGGHNDCCDVKLSVDFFASEDGTRLDLV